MDIHPDHPDLDVEIKAGRVIAYFGYGSLVNKHTLRTKFLAIRRAEIRGWRRMWLPRGSEVPALLSVRPEPGFLTQGVVVYDRAEHLPAVDEREAGYLRRVVDTADVAIANAPGHAPLFVYEAERDAETAAAVDAPILQSYLDAVLQGFLLLYGEAGVRRFVAETEGFETQVIADRQAPLYPRSVLLDEAQAHLFDALVSARGAAIGDVSFARRAGDKPGQ